MPTRRALATGVLAALLSAPAQAAPFRDDAGRAVTLRRPVRRVLPAGPPAAVLIYVLAPQLLAGWSRAPTAREKAYLLPDRRELPVFGRLTGRGDTANLEAVVAAAPDLFLDCGDVDRMHASLADRVQARTGIPYVLLDGALARTARLLRNAGAVLGVGVRAELLAVEAQEMLDAAARQRARAGPRVYFGRGPTGLETAAAGTVSAELIEFAGGVNVAARARGPVSSEAIAAWDPDIVIAPDPRFRASLRNDARWKTLRAVRKGRVVAPPSAPFGWIDTPPGVNRLLGLAWLQAVFGGEIGALTPTVRRFFELFYQTPVSEAQTRALIAGDIA